ncbi:MAG: adenylosuccinate lyase [Promethearchaeota archaeon]
MIHPMEYRYRTPEMASLFTEEAKLENWLRVEAALALTHASLGTIPVDAAEEIAAKANLDHVKLERVKQIEAEIHHDLMAMVRALTEACEGNAGKYVHLGATSYDVEDCATALQLGSALDVLRKSLLRLLEALVEQAKDKRGLVCVGRTHGQHALPTTYGMRFAVWAAEVGRHLERLEQLRPRVAVGKMSGAVGTMASFGTKGPEVQKGVTRRLGISPVLVANQVVQRDRHAELTCFLALVAATCDKIAREIRVLQRNEVGEVFEPFASKQVGSSTMPHKRNPHKSERICGLARVVKANAIVALENVTLEDERDLTNSAPERVIFAESFVLLDFMLHQLTGIVKGLEFSEENIRRNLELTRGGILTERVMLELVGKGIGRQEAHEMLRRAAIKARTTGSHVREVLLETPEIRSVVTSSELEGWFDPAGYTGEATSQVDRLVAHLTKKYLKERT